MVSRKIGFIGVGNMGQALLRAFIDSKEVEPQDIFITSRTEGRLNKVTQEFGVRPVKTNEELVELVDVVIVAVKPQDLYECLEPIASFFHEGHTVISLAAGISIESLQSLLPETKRIMRVMPNVAAKVQESVVSYACTGAVVPQLNYLESLLGSLGKVVPVEDGEQFESLMIAASSGVGFIFEIMSYWQEWLEERGIEPEVAADITRQTLKGAVALSESTPKTAFSELQKRVTSAKGVTAAGLESMRELEVERALRVSFEKAAIRDRELGQTWQKSN